MFGLNLFGVSAIDKNNLITVSGLNGYTISHYFERFWKTSVIGTHMFNKMTGGRYGRLEFHSFFAVEVAYMLDTLITSNKPNLPIRTLSKISEAIKRDTWLKDINKDIPGVLDFKRLELFNYKPLPFQQNWLEYYNKTPTQYRLNGALLNGSSGSGKTAMTMFTQVLAGVDKIIVVCPKNAIHRVWYDDIQRMFKTPPKIWNSSMPGAPSEDTFLRIYHYEALDRVMVDNEDLFDKYTFGLVLDESHNFNDVKSQRTQRWLELCKASGSRHIIHASGTPFKAMGSESIPLFRAIDPLFTPQVEERFKKIFGHSAQRGLDILKHRLGLTSFVIKKEELGLEKPEMITYSVKIPNGRDYTLAKVKEAMRVYIEERFEYYAKRADEDLAFYKACLETHADIIKGDRQKQAEFDKYKRDIAAIQEADKYSDYSSVKEEIMYCKRYEFTEISKSLPQNQVKAFRSVCSVIKYLKLKIQGECLGNVVGKMRIEAHRAMVKGIKFLEICESTEKKTVVFTSFVDVLEDSMNECKNQGLTPLLVYGKTNNDLNGIIRKFEKEEALNPLIATYDSLSTAVPLVMADTMIMVNAPFRSYIQDQAIARIHRLNQTSKTRVYQCYLDTGNEPNISTRSLDIMQWSQQQVEAMTGVKSPYTIDDTTLGVHVSAEGFDESLSFRLGEDTTPPRVSRVNSTFNLTTGSNVAKW